MRVTSDNAGVLPWLDTGLAGMVAASPLAAFCLDKLAAVAVAALL